jgi:hypothetical protein
MSKDELFNEVKKLSFEDRVAFIEKVLQSIREDGNSEQLSTAAESMQDYYRNDPEATEFTDLDQEDFYEPR